MAELLHIPKIIPLFPHEGEYAPHMDIAAKILAKILPTDLFSEKFTVNQSEQFQLLLPFLACIQSQKAPEKISFYYLAKFRSSSFKFFLEMISHWIIPGKRLNLVLIYAIDIQMPIIGQDVYTLCEIAVQADALEMQEILANFPIIEAEIKLGLESSYYARRILEVKGMAGDQKAATIHEHIAYLAKRLPAVFDHKILAEMQHVLVMSKEEFKAIRTSRHLSRIISIQYLFRKRLRELVKEAPEQRHLILKLFKSRLHENRNVLSILIGINYLRDKEFLEKKHLLSTIQSYIPEVHAVEKSFFADRRSMENIGTLYLEIEKTNGSPFTSEEIYIIRHLVPKDLTGRIEQLIHPVFMPCNEEEIMRNILTLCNEIRYLRDIPQVVINFDEQTHSHLTFSLILVRIALPDSPKIQDQFKMSQSSLEYIQDRSKIVGYLRKKYAKEATVFRVRLAKEHFLRRDHSIDLYKARRTIVTELSLIIGEFRDFNGGMITKQNELLNELKELIGENFKYNELLLENFFFSLMPVTMRSLLEPEALKTLFLMLLNAVEHGISSGSNYRIRQDLDFIFALIRIETSFQREELHKALHKLNIHSTELAHVTTKVHEIPYEGYIYRCDEPQKQQLFLQTIQNALCSELAMV